MHRFNWRREVLVTVITVTITMTVVLAAGCGQTSSPKRATSGTAGIDTLISGLEAPASESALPAGQAGY